MAISARKELLNNIRQYPNEENMFRKKMNAIQKRVKFKKQKKRENYLIKIYFQLHCCGIDEYRDWFNSDIWSGQSFVPDSCCIKEKLDCGKLINVNETSGLIYPDVC